MTWRVSSKADLVTWASNVFDVTNQEAKYIAQAVWDDDDFPHPVNNTDLTEYLERFDLEWVQDALTQYAADES